MEYSLKSVDSLLVDYLRERDPQEEGRLLERLALEVRAILARVLGVRFGRDAGERDRIEDACGDCLVAILTKVDRLKSGQDESPVVSLSAYAAAAAQNAFRGELRQQNPERYYLRQRILEAIKQAPQLSVWKYEGTVLCGLRKWEGSGMQQTPRLQEWIVSKAAFLSEYPECTDSGPDVRLESVLVRLFQWVGTPIELSDLVVQAADLLQVRNSRPILAGVRVSGQEETMQADYVEQLPDVSGNVEEHAIESLDREVLLHRAWEEILQLPVRQRTALLLALPPEAFMAYRLLVGPAALAECLELSRDQIDALPARLPIADAELAVSMGLKRQQVINLRLSARQRLARRIPQS